jgi:hypothetical protein
MARRFTLQQAESLLPELEAEVRRAIALKSEYAEAASEMEAISRRITLSGGAVVNREQLVRLKSRRDTSAAQLKEAIEAIQQFGCLVKDLDIGLLDFPTLFRGQEVYLCWRLGEPAIQFWHGVEEGFRGRKKIDRDFLDNHEGDSPN